MEVNKAKESKHNKWTIPKAVVTVIFAAVSSFD
jgi:hypothetical protein